MKTYTTDDLPLLLQNFISDYSQVFHRALVFAINRKLKNKSKGESDEKSESKSDLNTILQNKFWINKRHANAVIVEADGMIKSAFKCRENYIKDLEEKLKSADKWLKKREKYLQFSKKFYNAKNWQNKKTAPKLKLSCSLTQKRTTWECAKFQIHHKKRYINSLKDKIKNLKAAALLVTIPKEHQAYFVGSKGESYGNQVCQFDGSNLKIRVPKCLEFKYGETVEVKLNPLPYGQNKLLEALATSGETISRDKDGKIIKVTPIEFGIAMTYRFYHQGFRTFMAVSFEVSAPQFKSLPRQYGCIGIDINPNSIGWAYVDQDGNLVARGQIKFDVSSKSRGQTKAILGEIVKELTILSNTYKCPIVCESLDFRRKKASLRERGSRYARMLSNFVYSRFLTALKSRCFNLGIELIEVNPCYTSLIGLVKYASMYSLASDEAAAVAIARRGMQLSERLPRAITALFEVNSARHVWHGWNQLNNKLSGMKRHQFYSTVSNWELLINREDEGEEQSKPRSSRKRKC